jgi:hypothetical protein
MTMRFSRYILICSFLSFLILLNSEGQESSVYKIKRLPVNSGIFSDISPVIIEDGIIFCSDRRTTGITDRTSFENRRLYNIYIADKKDTSDWRKPEVVKSERSLLFNNGPLCVSSDGRTVYFTSEVETGVQTKNRKYKNHSGIFTAVLSGNELTSIKPFKFNSLSYNIGQPSVSQDGKLLFFASDMPGGEGGSDIYYCKNINGEWSDPVNLGPKVNSPSTENYPFIHNSGRLFFTSDRPGGMGGLDVYYTSINGDDWDDPISLASPINSSADDFAFVAQPDLQQGYFSSNRQRNDDIFEFITTIIRKSSCDTLEKNSYCYEFIEENAIKYDTMPFRYEWKFGDGNSATGKRVEHCYAGPGTYNVQLDVVNLVTQEVNLNEKSNILVVEDIEQGYISGPDVALSGTAIKFSADSTNLPGWNISRYYWNFGDETIATGSNVQKTFNKPGSYNIQLIISSDPSGGQSARETCVSKDIIIRMKQ